MTIMYPPCTMLTTDLLPIDMFVTELEPEAMFFLEAEPVTMSIPELEAATMSVPEGVLIQFAILQWCPPAFPASKLFLCQSHLAGVRS